jgi:monomeric sarcosine oxidase
VKPIDVQIERARTPGVDAAHHLNAAGASLPSARTLATLFEQLQLESRIGGYEAAAAVRPRLEAVYALAGGIVNASADEVALVESATVGWQRIVDALRLGRGDRVLVSHSSYVSCALHLLTLERERGVIVELVPNGPDGAIDLDALAAAFAAGPVALLALTHIPTSSGLVEPVAEAGRLARAAGATYLLDATQSVGQLPVDVQEIDCDALVTTGRKYLRGPRGTALLVVRRRLIERLPATAPDVRGAVWTADRDWTETDTARRFETWEASHALRLGLGIALAEAQALGIDAISTHLRTRAAALRGELGELPGVHIADPPAATAAIVTFTVDGRPAAEVAAELIASGVHATSVPAHHGRWDLGDRHLPAIVRASTHVYTDEEDLRALVEGVAGLARSAGATPTRTGGLPERVPVPPGPPVERVDAVVVGLGIHGSATVRALAAQGQRVVGLERFRFAHDFGSSHGETRMIRRAYPNPVWDPFVDRAYDAWARLGDAAGEPLLQQTGGVFARPVGAVDALRGPGCEVLDAAAVRGVFPGLDLGDELEGLYDPRAGILSADRALAALQLLARRDGAQLREAEPMAAWRTDGDGVVVDTVRGRLRADRLIVCGGAWTPALVPELVMEQRVVRIVNVYLEALDAERAAPPHLGVFSLDVGDDLFYGFGTVRGRGIKLGIDDGPDMNPDAPRPPASSTEVAQLVEVAQRFLPGLTGAVQESITCVYAVTPDRRFVVGALPATPQVLVASACSGHGFKFGPAIGEALADLATGTARPDLDFIGVERQLTARA